MDKIIRQRVSLSETVPLTSDDLSRLQAFKWKQLKLIFIAYIPLSMILLYMLIDGMGTIERNKRTGRMELDDEDITRFHEVVPWVCGFLFLMLTLYFLKLYLSSLAPVLKDLRRKEKTLLHFMTEKSDMATWDKFYLLTPIRKSQLVRVAREDFYQVDAGRPVTLEVGTSSCYVLGLSQDGRPIRTIEAIVH